MPVCNQCGEEHPVLDPVFRRPDAFASLSEESRADHAKADDDLCQIGLPGREARFFVRCVLPVAVHDRVEDLFWGVWAEVEESSFWTVIERWEDPAQAEEAPLAASLANAIPGYEDTLGLPMKVRLTGPSTRAEAMFAGQSSNRFAVECREGVTAHRAAEWLARQEPL